MGKRKPGGSVCAVVTCNLSSPRVKKMGRPDISFHRFPREPAFQKIWIQACKRRDAFNPYASLMCSEHFNSEDFLRDLKFELMGNNPVRRLKPGVVPTLKLPKNWSTKAAMQRVNKLNSILLEEARDLENGSSGLYKMPFSELDQIEMIPHGKHQLSNKKELSKSVPQVESSEVSLKAVSQQETQQEQSKLDIENHSARKHSEETYIENSQQPHNAEMEDHNPSEFSDVIPTESIQQPWESAIKIEISSECFDAIPTENIQQLWEPAIKTETPSECPDAIPTENIQQPYESEMEVHIPSEFPETIPADNSKQPWEPEIEIHIPSKCPGVIPNSKQPSELTTTCHSSSGNPKETSQSTTEMAENRNIYLIQLNPSASNSPTDETNDHNINYMRSVIDKLQKTSKHVPKNNANEYDSFDHFGKYIASMLRSTNQPTAMRLERDITIMVTNAVCSPPQYPTSDNSTSR